VLVGNDLLQSADVGIGSAFGLVSALFYSGFFLVAQQGRKQTDVLSFIWVSTLVSAVVLLTACVLLGQDLTGYEGRTVVFFVLMGVVIQVIGWLLITYAQGYFPASILSPTMLGQPVLTGLYSMMVFGERFSIMEFFGGLLVLGGVFLVHRSKHSRRKTERPLWKSM